MWNVEVAEFVGEEKLEKVILKNTQTEEKTEFVLDGVFVAIGHMPATGVFKDILDLDEKGYIKLSPNPEFTSATNIEGVFVAGDVQDYRYRQAITASGFGCMAGMDTLKFLDKSVPSW